MIENNEKEDTLGNKKTSTLKSVGASSTRVDLRVVSDRVSESFGSVLKSAREKKGFSRKDIARMIYIAEPVVEALEEQRFEKLPEDTYTKGYIKTYAALVGLNPEGLVKDFKQGKELCELNEQDRLLKDLQNQMDLIKEQAPTFDKAIQDLSDKLTVFKKQYRIYLLFLFTGVALGFTFFLNIVKEPIVVASEPIDRVKVLSAEGAIVVSDLMEVSDTPSLNNPNKTISADAEALLPANQLKMTFSDTTWVTLRNDKKELVHQSRKQKGESLELNIPAPFHIKLSKASAVQFSFNNQAIDFSKQVSDDDQLHDFVINP